MLIHQLLPIADTTSTHFAPYVPPKPLFSSSDIIALIALLISTATLLFAYYSSYLNKKLDIKFKKFESLGIDNIKLLFFPVDQVFEQHPTTDISNYLQYITENLVDIEIFLVQFKDLYSTLEINQIIKLKEELSDELFNDPKLVKDKKVIYMAYKAKIINLLYDFAMMDDIGFWYGFLRFIRIKR